MDTRWSLGGLDAVIFENRHLRVVVLPEIGAKVDSMVCKRADRDLLFHHPRVEPRLGVFGADVDNWWSGGIDEAAPTGHACRVDGEDLPFLGELWSLPWSVEQVDADAVTFSRAAVISPLRVRRTMRLDPDSSFVALTHELVNEGREPLQLLWGLHPSVPIGAATTVRLPAGRVELGEEGSAGVTREADGESIDWPADRCLRFGREPAEDWSLSYAFELEDGWLAVDDAEWGVGFAVTFPREVLSSVWIWAVDGGWRGIRCVAVEPWTGHPARLDRAIEAGRATTIGAGEELRFETRLVSYDPGAGCDDRGRPIGIEV